MFEGKKLLIIFILVVILLGALTLYDKKNSGDYKYEDAKVSFIQGGEEIGSLYVENSSTSYEISKGLQGRESLPENTGMLFVYEEEGKREFWMKDTKIPLDIIFIDGNNTILHVEEASPWFNGTPECSNPEYYCSEQPAKFVLETRRGYSDDINLSSGDKIVIEDLK